MSQMFSVGDVIEIVKLPSTTGVLPQSTRLGDRFTIECTAKDFGNLSMAYLLEKTIPLGESGSYCPCGKHRWVIYPSLIASGYAKLIKKEEIKVMDKKELTLIEKFQLATKTEPEKTFIKCGVMTLSGELTTVGKELFTQFLLEKFKDEFKTGVVDKVFSEEEKK